MKWIIKNIWILDDVKVTYRWKARNEKSQGKGQTKFVLNIFCDPSVSVTLFLFIFYLCFFTKHETMVLYKVKHFVRTIDFGVDSIMLEHQLY